METNSNNNQHVPEWYHVTVLSNFVRGYDKYKKHYSKAGISQSTFPNQFFVLKKSELAIGIAKAIRLLKKLGLDNDRLIVLKTSVPVESLRRDHESGLAQYIPQNYILIDAVYYLHETEASDDFELVHMQIEEVVAQSFEVIDHTLLPWQQLRPRTVSVLPIAMACQASCQFCFSKASVSSEFEGRISDWEKISSVLQKATVAGAERAVITGGGEPTLLNRQQLLRLVTTCASYFTKVVLITNAYVFGKMSAEIRLQSLLALDRAGLSVLAISRHHYDIDRNTAIMGIDTKTEAVTKSLRDNQDQFAHMEPRFICVLQKEGVSSVESVAKYLSWSIEQGVTQINFKELYVSTSTESVYSDLAANRYSAKYQVSLRVIHEFVMTYAWEKIAELPWGAPIYQGIWEGQVMQIAAYTEPSVYWERTHGIARSWNVMSNGTTLASLEDPMSQLEQS